MARMFIKKLGIFLFQKEGVSREIRVNYRATSGSPIGTWTRSRVLSRARHCSLGLAIKLLNG